MDLPHVLVNDLEREILFVPEIGLFIRSRPFQSSAIYLRRLGLSGREGTPAEHRSSPRTSTRPCDPPLGWCHSAGRSVTTGGNHDGTNWRYGPDFVLKNSNREEITLDSFAGKYLVLAFYPLAFTGGCTREMSTFQTQIDTFTGENAEVVGVSVDNWARAGQFAEKLCVTFPLLSDFPKNEAGQDYGVYDADRGFHSRVTFVISPDRTVIGTHSSPPPAEPESHVDAALQLIRQQKG